MARGIVKGSIRSTEGGFSRISIGKATHINLKRLAERKNMSMSAVLKRLVESELDNKQTSFGAPLRREATLAGIKADTEDIREVISTMSLSLPAIEGFVSGFTGVGKETVTFSIQTGQEMPTLTRALAELIALSVAFPAEYVSVLKTGEGGQIKQTADGIERLILSIKRKTGSIVRGQEPLPGLNTNFEGKTEVNTSEV